MRSGRKAVGLPREIARLSRLTPTHEVAEMRRSHAAHFSSSKCLFQRKGSIVVLAAFLMVLMVACIAFAVDLGCLYVARGQAQSCADAAALAAGWTMAGDDRIRQDSGNAFAAASRKAIETAALEDINHSIRPVAGVPSSSVVSEVLFGRLDNPDNHGEALSFPPPRQCNTVLVRVACTPERNTPVPLFFARIFGLRTAGVKAEAAAIFEDHNTVGFRVTKSNPELQRDAVRGQAARTGKPSWPVEPRTIGPITRTRRRSRRGATALPN